MIGRIGAVFAAPQRICVIYAALAIQFARVLIRFSSASSVCRKIHNRQKRLAHIYGLESSDDIFQRADSPFDDLIRNASGLRRANCSKNIVKR